MWLKSARSKKKSKKDKRSGDAAGKRCYMENIITGIKFACGIVAAIVSNIFGGIDALFTALLICIVVDYVTGILAAIYEKKLNSTIGFRGILKKIAILCIVVLAHELEVVVGVGGIRDLAVGFYIANEGISILENCAKMNVPVARNLSGILEQLKEKLDKEDDEDV